MASNIKSSKELRELPAYEYMYEERLEDLNGTGLCFRHKKSGARICIISNDDENKVFCVGFRTPPFDSTGVAHIVEHTVLCGSKKFPAKDPFIELAKGSLNTFLNAMTYSDKTIYPVASCNDKDFRNLSDVYMDAVFNPNIHYKEEIFRQEGWHYEMETAESPLTINGIVYSEMKGAYSQPEQVLARYIQSSLLPDTAYAVESGGDPEVIPELSYEEFKNFHKRYYHPVNSYIYVYGNMDIEEQLEWLDREYLCKYDIIEIDSAISLQKPLGYREEVKKYSISESEDTKDKTFLSYNFSLKNKGVLELAAMDIISGVLFDAPGAPVKQAVLDAGIGDDVSAGLMDGMLQPYFIIEARNTEYDKKDEFVRIIKDAIRAEAEKGFDKASLKAAINKAEFRYREADFGGFPKGLMYIINSYATWLYDDNKAFTNFHGNDNFTKLKEYLDTGYFEKLAMEEFLAPENDVLVSLVPEKGLNAKNEKELADRLAKYKESLTEEEINKIVEDTKNLKEYQEEPSTKEQLETIPLLSISDIKKETEPVECNEGMAGDVPVLSQEVFTNGIAYIKLMFDMDCVPEELIPYTGILGAVFAYVDTEKYSFRELDNEINIRTGGINGAADMLYRKGCNDYRPLFVIGAKTLNSNIKDVFELVSEIINSSSYADKKRLYEIIAELKAALSAKITSAGHSLAVLRAASYYSASGYYEELYRGIAYYEFVSDLYNNFEARREELVEGIKKVSDIIYTRGNLLVSVTADADGIAQVIKETEKFAENLKAGNRGVFAVAAENGSIADWKSSEKVFKLNDKKEGFKTAGQVQFVARCGNFLDAGYEYTGAITVLKTILGYDYLWNNVRVKGGAYGCMSGASQNGSVHFVSYRDPKLAETVEVYEKLPEYLRSFEADDREMTKYIIGTMSTVDKPLTPKMKGARSMGAYLSGRTTDDFQKERDEILSADVEAIRATADLFEAVMAQGYFCTVGSETKIEECRDMFAEVKSLA